MPPNRVCRLWRSTLNSMEKQPHVWFWTPLLIAVLFFLTAAIVKLNALKRPIRESPRSLTSHSIQTVAVSNISESLDGRINPEFQGWIMPGWFVLPDSVGKELQESREDRVEDGKHVFTEPSVVLEGRRKVWDGQVRDVLGMVLRSGGDSSPDDHHLIDLQQDNYNSNKLLDQRPQPNTFHVKEILDGLRYHDNAHLSKLIAAVQECANKLESTYLANMRVQEQGEFPKSVLYCRKAIKNILDWVGTDDGYEILIHHHRKHQRAGITRRMSESQSKRQGNFVPENWQQELEDGSSWRPTIPRFPKIADQDVDEADWVYLPCRRTMFHEKILYDGNEALGADIMVCKRPPDNAPQKGDYQLPNRFSKRSDVEPSFLPTFLAAGPPVSKPTSKTKSKRWFGEKQVGQCIRNTCRDDVMKECNQPVWKIPHNSRNFCDMCFPDQVAKPNNKTVEAHCRKVVRHEEIAFYVLLGLLVAIVFISVGKVCLRAYRTSRKERELVRRRLMKKSVQVKGQPLAHDGATEVLDRYDMHWYQKILRIIPRGRASVHVEEGRSGDEVGGSHENRPASSRPWYQSLLPVSRKDSTNSLNPEVLNLRKMKKHQNSPEGERVPVMPRARSSSVQFPHSTSAGIHGRSPLTEIESNSMNSDPEVSLPEIARVTEPLEPTTSPTLSQYWELNKHCHQPAYGMP